MPLSLDNPYLLEFEQSMPAWRVPAPMRKLSLQRYLLRQQLVARYAWAIPSTPAIELLLRFDPLVEMGAGTGYWAWLVRQAGGDIVAFDRYPPPDPRNRWHRSQGQWTEVRPGGSRLLRQYSDRSLLLCWPPEDQHMAMESLAAYPGRCLVYVGEIRPGPFTDELARWELIESLDIPQWEGVADRMVVVRRPQAAS